MKRLVIQTIMFSEELDELISKKKLLAEDFMDFELGLVAFPDMGNVIQGTGGLRKTRLKSATKGKSGGFRVCYCDAPEKEKLFLVAIFPKMLKKIYHRQKKSILNN